MGIKFDYKSSSHMKVARLKATEEAQTYATYALRSIINNYVIIPSGYAGANPEV